MGLKNTLVIVFSRVRHPSYSEVAPLQEESICNMHGGGKELGC